jgi:hypothetical protein
VPPMAELVKQSTAAELVAFHARRDSRALRGLEGCCEPATKYWGESTRSLRKHPLAYDHSSRKPGVPQRSIRTLTEMVNHPLDGMCPPPVP